MAQTAATPLPIVILISGALSVEIRAVISNRPDANGLDIARSAGIAIEILDHKLYADRHSYDRALQALIDTYQPGLVVLAGFMRLLTDDFVAHYHGRMLNIHPSLLPELPGLNTHRRAIEAGHSEHGASVHFVTPEVDGGPVLLQARVPVKPDDDPETLAARVLAQEHRLYPLAIQWFAERRIFLDEHGHIVFDHQPLLHPRDLATEHALPC